MSSCGMYVCLKQPYVPETKIVEYLGVKNAKVKGGCSYLGRKGDLLVLTGGRFDDIDPLLYHLVSSYLVAHYMAKLNITRLFNEFNVDAQVCRQDGLTLWMAIDLAVAEMKIRFIINATQIQPFNKARYTEVLKHAKGYSTQPTSPPATSPTQFEVNYTTTMILESPRLWEVFRVSQVKLSGVWILVGIGGGENYVIYHEPWNKT
ncbi:MAG: hypothetical protein ACK4SY_10745, partial [Pyrobaculum sp.]